jgi:hypothetical protein
MRPHATSTPGALANLATTWVESEECHQVFNSTTQVVPVVAYDNDGAEGQSDETKFDEKCGDAAYLPC